MNRFLGSACRRKSRQRAPSHAVVDVPLDDETDALLRGASLCFYDAQRGRTLRVKTPDARLTGLRRVCVRGEEDLGGVPDAPGNYWILTDEPVSHCFHAGKRVPAKQADGLTVVYNGVSAALRARAREHLLRPDDRGGFGTQSGLSVDVRAPSAADAGRVASHSKCLWSEVGGRKLPKVREEEGGTFAPLTRENLASLNLSREERAALALGEGPVFFKNGIDVRQPKHRGHRWVFAFAPLSDHSLRDHIEEAWRKAHGLPALCSYASGR